MPDELRVAVVTGSSQGIGRGLVESFVQQGYRVEGCSRGEAPPLAGLYEHARVDIRSEEEVRRWISDVGRRHGRIDVLVNNAGVSMPALALMTSGASAEDAIRTNVMGTFLVSREVARVMLRRKWGRIINISSMAAALHMPGTSAYAASKAAITEMSKVLACELAPFSITVNVVAPSIVETEMLASLGPEVVESCRQALAIKRLCTLDDIRGVISFLASDAASYVTGQVLYLGYVA
jgi:3-oxoacyl-[acyl-carrier protein] reductase